jgi:glutamate synthase (ferredoxin)
MNKRDQRQPNLQNSSKNPFMGQPWLVEERDACGVGFIASVKGEQTHRLVQQTLAALGCLEHRGGCSADRDSGDGAGIMTALPHQLFSNWFAAQSIGQPKSESYGVAMVFLPQDQESRKQSKSFIEKVATDKGLTILGWREVPVNSSVLGQQALDNQPYIAQLFVTAKENLLGDELDRLLYIVRSEIGKKLTDDFYICSFSCRTVVYKGMVRSEILAQFYLDLQNPYFTSFFAVYHRRFSTNTMPKWPLAQPMRLLGHNGEINTILGNISWMSAREKDLDMPGWTKQDIESLIPIVNTLNSDSYNLDSTMELLVRGGHSPLEAAMILVPEAYENQPDLKNHQEIIDFYDFYSGIQEPWDGPALLVFSDGKTVGASLDRNGLRPARYVITEDGYLYVASEAGVVEIDEALILEKGRLGPGQMIAVDLKNHQILQNWQIKEKIAQKHPYGQWVKNFRQDINYSPFETINKLESAEELLRYQTTFGFTAEDVDMIIQPMAWQSKEPTFCMGEDTPLAVLSNKPHLLYDYFKQRFAQVTNPAIDPLRESLVMSLKVFLGERGNILNPSEADGCLLKLDSPFLNETELALIKKSGFNTVEISTLFAIVQGPSSLANALEDIQEEVAVAVKTGAKVIILSDRVSGKKINEDFAYIPPLLAVGVVHQFLIKEGVRLKVSLVVDTAQCWSTHHFASLIGYGASAICPHLTLETIRWIWSESKTQKLMENGKLEAISLEVAMGRYRKAVEAGILKILSKMGISLLSSYHGAQIFEAIGLDREVIDIAFSGTASRIGGLTIEDIAHEVVTFHAKAYPELTQKKLENCGFINYRSGGEYHMNSPEMAKALHKAVAAQRDGTGYDHYEFYRQYLESRPVTALRDLLDFNSDRPSIALDHVQPVEEIIKLFCTGGMSLGALSREAHETLAIAMNRIGGKSNSGEGGEDPLRDNKIEDIDEEEGKSVSFPHLKGLVNGDSARSSIRQVASGRFGVTPAYLMNAEQIEIKLAQGAKPGEGGQLPGKKVSSYIAMLRRSKPGVDLISPPPHHDIYSIEDLAQLIFDLHQINPQAKVSVKLVAEIGIGTIAAGVAKANADVIQVSGHDGGTGASPLSSIKHAGGPWELGLTEVHRVLLENGLRDRVILRADGGLKTGWDVVIAALMGSEEFGFGSVAMIAEGCIMARVCHTNNCPVGVATQQEQLRQRFKGIPDHVVNFFYFVAEEVRSLLAHLGYRSLQEVVGRSDLLKMRENLKLTKTNSLNLDCLIKLPDVKENRSWLEHVPVHSNEPVLDDQILADPEIKQAIEQQLDINKEYRIVNTDRTVGTRIAGVIAQAYGNRGISSDFRLKFVGSAGQSFAAFNLPGMSIVLEGEANDYVGKGMHGGEIVIIPSKKANFEASQNVIIGNTCLYGATGGTLYANGRAGVRFAVRNSLANAVIEGAGDHCCEYMTGGVIVVLGRVGRNVGAGMTGGLAYFLDEEGNLVEKINRDIIKIQPVLTSAGVEQLKNLITIHVERTGSVKGQKILANFQEYLPLFWQAVPPSEANTPETNSEFAAENPKNIASV